MVLTIWIQRSFRLSIQIEPRWTLFKERLYSFENVPAPEQLSVFVRHPGHSAEKLRGCGRSKSHGALDREQAALRQRE